MRNHVRHCVPTAIRTGGEEAETVYDELVDLFYRNAR
jgi:CsoR family transcriptional regulator, copper-sensing transcriptional repressor